ncbi:MAG: phosphoribosyl-AMP cyclohydrolase [Chloroflexota bacterium]
MSWALEEGPELSLDFNKVEKIASCGESVLPVVVQDAKTREVLILAYANELAVNHTLVQGIATFWSTSRNELWVKGATSGDTLSVVEVRVNCEQNSLLYLVNPEGQGACHTKDGQGKSRSSCYYRRIEPKGLCLINAAPTFTSP